MKKLSFLAASIAVLSLSACGQSPAADAVENQAANEAAMLENSADNLQMQADNATGNSADMLENQADNMQMKAENIVDTADAKADNMADGDMMSTNTATSNMTNAM